ncbi:MAG: nucleotidyltransferase family protein [Desulfobacteraceae bacterium]|nr:nucleotidyltransferase family protein [Desulfobacteraceae bacterium]MBU4001275.1 nucleotidyltransferase family protein [Pseudomonadota bacterium]MBU4053479.1 nucleotidyltransferase family protein [Pseudomonadota bacterium]
MKAGIDIPQDQVAEFCQRWRIDGLAFFGSVLHDGFRPDSDVDVLVRFNPKAAHTLFDMVRMQKELEGILGRKIDLVSRRAIEMSRNYIRKKAILDAAEVVYGS